MCDVFVLVGLLFVDEVKQDFVKGNVKVCICMVIQYEIVGMVDGLVLGIDYFVENIMGFYIKYGDGVCDLVLLFGLSKCQVRQVVEYFGVLVKIIYKVFMVDLESLFFQKVDE